MTHCDLTRKFKDRRHAICARGNGNTESQLISQNLRAIFSRQITTAKMKLTFCTKFRQITGAQITF